MAKLSRLREVFAHQEVWAGDAMNELLVAALRKSALLRVSARAVIAVSDRYEAWKEKRNAPPPPPGPQQTLAALQKITVAHGIMQKVTASLDQGYTYDNYIASHHELVILARIINEGRAYDPSVVVATDEGERTFDELTAEACYLEARNLSGLAANWPPSGPYQKLTRNVIGQVNGTRVDEYGTLKERRKKAADALPPIDKAIHFQPYNVKYRAEKVRILLAMNDRKRARAAADEGLQLDPANLDLLTLREL